MAMNEERMLTVADRIEALGKGKPVDGLSGFDMGEWWGDDWDWDAAGDEMHKCGTVGCIAGTCYALRIEEGKEKPDTFYNPYYGDLRGVTRARKDLGLTQAQADELFNGRWEGAKYIHEITATEAAQALRDIATGKLVWNNSGYWEYARGAA